MIELPVVWCQSCDQPATGTDERCDFCRACNAHGLAIPDITNHWLRRQWLAAKGLAPMSEAELEATR